MGGRGAVSSTVASTKQSVIMLQNRSADMLSRSGAGGVIDFNGEHDNTSGVRSGFSSRSRFSPARRLREGASTFSSSSSSSSRVGGIGSTRVRVSGGGRGGNVTGNPSLPLGLSFEPRSVSSDARLTPALAPVSEVDIEDAPAVSGLDRTVYSEPGVTPAYARPAAVRSGRRQSERQEHPGILDQTAGPEREETTAAGRVGEFLSALPLSKLKIVIGKPILGQRRFHNKPSGHVRGVAPAPGTMY